LVVITTLAGQHKHQSSSLPPLTTSPLAIHPPLLFLSS
jgi:hypothetical protein